jgi:formate hydrogenlyase subunit 3/multisubunit Na+/H+ antiporter MnhD subunit
MLILFGVVLVAVGLVLTLGTRILPLGRLPGDIVIRRDGFTLYFPLMTSIVLSLILTLLGFLLSRR